ncbi:MAG: hypothetical protein LBR68_00370, partial [Lachnoclostridium sp.]|nr:hypothetical protein [Lachnoclostridium sp.]
LDLFGNCSNFVDFYVKTLNLYYFPKKSIRARKPDMYWFCVQVGFHGLQGVNLVMTIAPEYS